MCNNLRLVDNGTLGIDAQVETNNVNIEGQQQLTLSKLKLRQKGLQYNVYTYVRYTAKF